MRIENTGNITTRLLENPDFRSTFCRTMREMRQKLAMCKETLDRKKYAPLSEKNICDFCHEGRLFRRVCFYGIYLNYLIDLIDFGEKEDLLELFLKRKEVDAFAERIVSDKRTGCCSHCSADYAAV